MGGEGLNGLLVGCVIKGIGRERGRGRDVDDEVVGVAEGLK